MPDGVVSVVPPVEDWTPQEKFVWERVAAGAIANFNTADGYGGYLDPKRPEGLPDNRVLRSAFLETILLKEPYRRSLTRRGVTIAGARFTEAIELEGAELEHRLGLAISLIEKGADLRRLRSKYPINLSGSKVVGTLLTSGLDLDADLLMRSCEFAEVDLTVGHVGGQLTLDGSMVTGKLDMTGLDVDQHLFMRSKAGFTEVQLANAHIGGQLSLDGSKVTGKLNMNGLHVEQHLIMGGKAEFAEVDLTGARIGGALSLIGSRVTGKLNMNSLRVEQSLLMSDKAEFAEVELTSAHIGKQLDLNGSKVTGKLDMSSLYIEQHLIMSGKAEFADVDLMGADIGGNLELVESTVNGTLDCDSINVGRIVLLARGATFLGPISLIFAKIGRNLELAGGAFGNQVDITGARIGSELRLGSARHPPATWQARSALILHNASVDTIQDSPQAWPDRLDLNGFNYQSLGGINATDKDSMLERSLAWFETWLAKQERYAAQPYERLAICLKNNGKSEMVTAIRYAGSERERRESSGWWRYIWLTIFKYSVGYGYRPWRALGWAAALVLLGAAVLQISAEGLRNNMPYGFAYSFDMLLPLVKLRESHYKIDLLGWARYYFYGHKIMGYLLASFLIAGLSGLRAGSVSRE
jgi:uncharacterized protein YjbI with pentapeptide repeats